jgi:hypothetical protein
MTIENIPVWPIEPNWNEPVKETLEWLTDIMTSPTGAEQRRCLRKYPRKDVEFSVAVEGADRAYLDQFFRSHGGKPVYLPLWFEAYWLTANAAAGSSTLPINQANNGGIKAGDILFIGSLGRASDYELVEVASVGTNSVTLVSPLETDWPRTAKVHPVRKARIPTQPAVRKLTDQASSVTPQFRIMQENDDVVLEDTRREVGPMIMDGLITNSYHIETGRGGYFHTNSGTSEGQSVMIFGMLLAYQVLRVSSVVSEREAADYYFELAQEMLDAMGDGSTTGPMIRQPFPEVATDLTLPHWLFAARGDVPEQGIVYEYQVTRSGSTLTIPANANGARVHEVWRIYPATSELLYESPYSPAFDIASPAGDTSIEITNWQKVGDTTVITIPGSAPSGITQWKIVYGYYKPSYIAQADAYEAYPNWTRISPGYSACAPDTFRWFEQALERAVALDDRPGMADRWQKLRLALRRSAVAGQAISDLREVFKPMPGFDVIPASGQPDGMFCYSDHPSATPPIGSGLDNNWTGYDFWSRAANGDIIGNIPAASTVNQVQLGRGFSDAWRTATSYQDADQYLYVAVSATKKPVAANKEFFLVYVSATMDFDPSQRWYADLGSLASFVATSGDVIEFFIPRTAFRLRSYDTSGNTVWGSTLPAGTELQNFGISSEMSGAYQIRLRKMRLVTAATAEAVEGAPMPFFPGALPFAINADLNKEAFVGWNGSPFHGYQLADHWWWLSDDANAVHPTLTAAKLPIPNRTTGATTFPLSATTAGGVTKPKHALLMEQQLMFLKHAQEQWVVDGGSLGPFAHTFVLNTDARSTIGSPTPHTWVYTNDDPNTRWVGYQVRIVESLTKIAELASGTPSFATAVDLAVTMASNWLSWLNGFWPDLDGQVVGGVTIYGMPTDYDDPATGQPQTFYEEPHAAAIILRACLQLQKVGKGNASVNNALMLRCWNYMEMIWRTTGEMAYTWSPDPAKKQWYGFWHGEIITTLAEMLLFPTYVAAGINLATVRQRLVQTTQWLQRYGVAYNNSGAPVSFLDVYRGFNVLTADTDEGSTVDSTYERMMEEYDNDVGIALFRDSAELAFQSQTFHWVNAGRAEYEAFKRLTYHLAGRFMAVWLPTGSADMTVALDTPAGEKYLIVENFGYTEAGEPTEGRKFICVYLKNGTRLYRMIKSSTLDSSGREILSVDRAFYDGLTKSSVLRVSFMQLSRLNQDRLEIVHKTDTRGASLCSATFRAAPNIRQVKSGIV